MVRKKLNLSNPGDSTHFGSDDLDYVNNLFTGADQSATDAVDMNTSWKFRGSKLQLANPANTFKYNESGSAITADRNITWPLMTADGSPLIDNATQTVTNKTADAEANTLVNGQSFPTYTVYISGVNTKARNWSTGVTTSAADASTIINSLITAMTNGGTIAFTDSVFTINSPLTGWPDMRPFNFIGVWDNFRNGGTRFSVGSSFPNNGYVFDTSANTVGSGKAALINIDGLEVYNLNFATINAGFMLLENDKTAYSTGPLLRRIWLQYMWRGLHLKGYVWEGVVDNFFFNSASTTFVGNAAVITELAGHSDMPKVNLFTHLHGTGPTASQLDNFILLKDAGYNTFVDTFVDGFKYTEAPVSFKGNAIDNVFYNLYLLDLNVPSGTNIGAVLFDGTGGSTNTLACANNRIYDGRMGNYPVMAAYRNSAQRTYVEVCGYFGSAATIDDSGAGTNNVVVIKNGPVAPATADTKIVSTNGIVRIIDNRNGARNTGLSATQSGNGSTTVFNIAHGCFATPGYVMAQPATADARGDFSLSATATNVVITYPVAPPTGTNNLQWYWNAQV